MEKPFVVKVECLTRFNVSMCHSKEHIQIDETRSKMLHSKGCHGNDVMDFKRNYSEKWKNEKWKSGKWESEKWEVENEKWLRKWKMKMAI